MKGDYNEICDYKGSDFNVNLSGPKKKGDYIEIVIIARGDYNGIPPVFKILL